MKNWKKTLLLCLCIVAVVTTSVVGTLAWLTDSETAVNTFTVGHVDITLDEAKVDPDGIPVPGADRVQGNEYHLIPGQTYVKDPTMTVDKDSEESYVRMLVTVNCRTELEAINAPGVTAQDVIQGWDPAVWVYEGKTEDAAANTVTYEFRYATTVAPDGSKDLVLDALFDSFTIPGVLDGDDLASIQDLEITVAGHAIQAAGFADADAAWAAFDNQVNP